MSDSNETNVPAAPETEENGVTVASLLRRVTVFLDDGNWQKADEYCERVLDRDPENAQAYLGKLMARVQVREKNDLKSADVPLETIDAYRKLQRYGDPALREELAGYAAQTAKNSETRKRDAVYADAKASFAKGTLVGCDRAIRLYGTIPGWKDADALREQALAERGDRAKREIRRNRRIILGAFAALLAVAIVLTSIIVVASRPKWSDTAVMKRNSDLFTDRKNLKSVTIRDGVTEIGDFAFRNCTSLTEIVIPESVTTIGMLAFSGCSSLTKIVIPESVTRIGDYAFQYCTSLTEAVFPQTMPEQIGDSIFYGCNSLKNLTISFNGVDPDDYFNTYSFFSFTYCPVTTVTVTGGTVLPKNAFSNFALLTSVTLPESITRIEYSAFRGCKALTAITLPHSLKVIVHNAFDECDQLKEISYNGTKAEWKAVRKEHVWTSYDYFSSDDGYDGYNIRCTDGIIRAN